MPLPTNMKIDDAIKVREVLEECIRWLKEIEKCEEQEFTLAMMEALRGELE
jgi:hypothetical protein